MPRASKLEFCRPVFSFLKPGERLPGKSVAQKDFSRITRILFTSNWIGRKIVRSFFKNAIFSLAVVAAALLNGSWLSAQNADEPAVIVSIAKLEEQLKDVVYFAEAAGMKPMAMMAKAQIEGFTKGLDQTKPAGALLYFTEGNPQPKAVVFLPIKDLDDILNGLANFGVDLDEDQDPMVLNASGMELFLKQSGGYGFVSEDKELLANLPSKPEEILGDLPKNYNFSARLYAQRIPQELRDQALEMIEQGYLQQLEEMGEDIGSELQKKNFEMQMVQIKSMVNETEELILGFSIDQEGKNLHFDGRMVGLDGSIIARSSQMYANAKPSQFKGFLMDGAAFNANMSGEIHEEEIAQYKQMIAQLKEQAMKEIDGSEGEGSDADKELGKKVIGDIIDVLEETIEAGVIDMGAVAMVDDESMNAAFGFRCASTEKLESALRELAKKAEEEAGDKVEIKMDAEKKFGARFHKVVIPVPEDEEEARKLFGEEATIYVGIANDVVYVAGGNSPMELLEKAVNGKGSSKDADAPMQYNVFLGPILRKVAQMQDEEVVQQMADKLTASGRDRIRFSANGVDNGVQMRVEIQDGILEIISIAAQQMGGMMGGGGRGSDF